MGPDVEKKAKAEDTASPTLNPGFPIKDTAEFFEALAGGAFLCMFLMVPIQGVMYLYYGNFPAWTFLTVFQGMFPNIYRDSWLQSPESWLGLHKIVIYLVEAPLAAFMFVLGFALIGLGGLLSPKGK